MKLVLRLSAGLAAGAGLGYLYYYFIGCQSGSCPITSNWEISVLYGAAIGLIVAFPTKKRGEKDGESDENR